MPGGHLSGSPEDAALGRALLEPGEAMLRISRAEPGMVRAGVVAWGWAIAAFAIAWFPLHRVLTRVATFAMGEPIWPFILFGIFGLFWLIVGVRLLWEPLRLHRLYPHVVHLLTDRRLLAVDRRTGPLHDIALADIRQMKTFFPFGRLTV